MINVTEVDTLIDSAEVNARLENGWVLLEAGIDPEGFPLFVVGKRPPCLTCKGSGQLLQTNIEEERLEWKYAECPDCGD